MNNVIELNTNDAKHEKLSEKYKLVETKKIAEKFRSLGFTVDQFSSKKTRDPGKVGYTKHVVRLSNPSLLSFKDGAHKDIKIQLLVTNSHDGTTGFKMQLGFYRLVCANGMVVGETFESISMRHTGMILENIDGAIERMVAQLETLNTALHRMKNTQLTSAQLMNFMSDAIKLRSDKVTCNVIPIKREEDRGTDLFTVLNRAQETIIRGGVQSANSLGRVRSLRAIKNVDREVKLNQQVFDLAMQYMAA